MTDSTTVSRRTVAAGAAWAVPTVVLATQVPAYAASDINVVRGLNGWVHVTKDCGNSPDTVEIDGRGTFTGGGDDDRGLWVFASDPTQPPSNAFIVFFLPNGLTINWSVATGNASWSVPVIDSSSTPPAQSGFTKYRMSYSGTWTYNSIYGAWVANGQPHFYGVTNTNSCPTLSITAFRSVTISGSTYSFYRTISL